MAVGKESTIRNGRYTVVLAHDLDDEQEVLRVALADSGSFDVVGEACTGEELVSTAHALQPDAVIVRLLIPGGDGLAIICRVLDVSWQSIVAVLCVAPNGDTK